MLSASFWVSTKIGWEQKSQGHNDTMEAMSFFHMDHAMWKKRQDYHLNFLNPFQKSFLVPFVELLDLCSQSICLSLTSHLLNSIYISIIIDVVNGFCLININHFYLANL